MQVGLIGLPQAGKRTILRLLTGVDAAAAAPGPGGTIPGICPVRDPRFDKLVAMYRPKKSVPATIQYVLLPDLTKDAAGNRDLLKAVGVVDVLAHVARAFPDDTVFHVDGTVDPLRDVDTVQAELLLHDLLFVETRLERLAKDRAKRGAADQSSEPLLKRMQEHLNANRPLRTFPLEPKEQTMLSGATLLTRKPMLIVLNMGEADARDRRLAEEIATRYPDAALHAVSVSAKIEEELSQLDDPAERAAFLQDLGIEESAIDRFTRVSYEALGYLSYFTVGEDEVRAWTVRRGALAPEAGGAIHSDIERGFIRAELIAYADLMAYGSEQAVAQAGKGQLKGKDYVVQDGDILNFRFSV